MPRKSGLQSLLRNLRRQSTKTLAALRQEIAKREKELEALKATESRWKNIVSERPGTLSVTTSPRMRAGRKRRRLDWNVVLAGLPATFNTKEVQQKTSKPMEQVYAGLSRWVKDKKVKRNSSGTYQKISLPSPVQQKKG